MISLSTGAQPEQAIKRYGFFDLFGFDSGDLVPLCTEAERLLETVKLPTIKRIIELQDEMD